MTELELKIEKWLENEQFVAFANERMNNARLFVKVCGYADC